MRPSLLRRSVRLLQQASSPPFEVIKAPELFQFGKDYNHFNEYANLVARSYILRSSALVQNISAVVESTPESEWGEAQGAEVVAKVKGAASDLINAGFIDLGLAWCRKVYIVNEDLFPKATEEADPDVPPPMSRNGDAEAMWALVGGGAKMVMHQVNSSDIKGEDQLKERTKILAAPLNVDPESEEGQQEVRKHANWMFYSGMFAILGSVHADPSSHPPPDAYDTKEKVSKILQHYEGPLVRAFSSLQAIKENKVHEYMQEYYTPGPEPEMLKMTEKEMEEEMAASLVKDRETTVKTD